MGEFTDEKNIMEEDLTADKMPEENAQGATAGEETLHTDSEPEKNAASEQEGEAQKETAEGGTEKQTEEGSKDGEAPEEEQAHGMGLFGKKKKDKKDELIAELKDRVTRQMAEFDNFRKRTEREKSAMFEVGAKSVIEKMLPIVDNFERGLGTTQEDSEDPFIVGMHKIYKQMLTTLEELDVKPIPAVGEEFNPDFHNAVLHVEDESVGENIIVEELQKGYMYRDSVVRHSMVKVAN